MGDINKEELSDENISEDKVREAFRIAHNELWNDKREPIFHGEFNPEKYSEDFIEGIMYVMNTMLVKGNELDVWQEQLPKFTINIFKSYNTNNQLPKVDLDEEEKIIFIQKLRTYNDDLLNFIADEYENNQISFKVAAIDKLIKLISARWS